MSSETSAPRGPGKAVATFFWSLGSIGATEHWTKLVCDADGTGRRDGPRQGPLALGDGLRYFIFIFSGSCSLLMVRRNKNAVWRSLGTVCRERDWSRPRAIHELQNGLPFRTVPPGHEHKIDWHDSRLLQHLNLATSEVSSEFLSPLLTVGIEVLPPSDAYSAVNASAGWAIATTRRLQEKSKIPAGVTKAKLARLLEAEAQKAVCSGVLRRPLKASDLEKQLSPWGIWPLNSFE
jgi:hypothetical protein